MGMGATVELSGALAIAIAVSDALLDIGSLAGSVVTIRGGAPGIVPLLCAEVSSAEVALDVD